jgi:hypothetical protein
VYEIGSQDGIDFMVMEYISGQTLDTLIRQVGEVVQPQIFLARRSSHLFVTGPAPTTKWIVSDVS